MREEAARSFREAQKRDPDCAMCHPDEAWAWGPYRNGQMGSEIAPRAYAAIQRALALKANAVLCESVWVLTQRAQATRAEIADLLDRLLLTELTVVPDTAVVEDETPDGACRAAVATPLAG
ncbi:MAG TPA: hypothetical protein VLE53_10285 [Gemmatimonadaceae bacterium]|nr:hypothetical protein [Gemmatimonadaceae bacterium]